MSQRPHVRYWWVNHGSRAAQSGAAASGGGDYLHCFRRSRNGSGNAAYRNLLEVQSGDFVFAYSAGAVRGVGVALRDAHEVPGSAPAEWRLPIRLLQLDVPLSPKAHMAQLKPVLPRRFSPLRASGVRNPGSYLTPVSAGMVAVLRLLLAGQLEDIEAQISAVAGSELADDWIETSLRHRTDIGPTDKRELIRARRGQGAFRHNVEKMESACRLTGLLDRRHLRAIHIKPWSAAEDREKLDGCNGLLLSPHVAHLFARGYISFADDGALLISGQLNPAVVKSWNLRAPINAGAFRPQQRLYLDYHRREVFDRPEIGRRTAQKLRTG